jgi:hypothetical protein
MLLRRRQETDLAKQACEHTYGVRTTAEAHEEHPIAGPPRRHEKRVGFLDVARQTPAEREAAPQRSLLCNPRPKARLRQRAHAGIVVGNLVEGVLDEHLEEAHDVGIGVTELVGGAVAAYHEIAPRAHS